MRLSEEAGNKLKFEKTRNSNKNERNKMSFKFIR